MPTSPKPLPFALPLALLALLLPGAAFAQGQNAVTAVAVRDGNIEIVATQPPNFTTFTMSDPTRLVVDVAAHATAAFVPPVIAIPSSSSLTPGSYSPTMRPS